MLQHQNAFDFKEYRKKLELKKPIKMDAVSDDL